MGLRQRWKGLWVRAGKDPTDELPGPSGDLVETQPAQDASTVESKPFIGRENALAQLAQDTSAVIVIAGKPGIGKTEFTSRAAEAAQGTSVAPLPLAVANRPGSLQLTLLSSLADALVQHAHTESSVDRLARIVNSAVANVADGRLRSARESVGHFLLGVIQDKLGETAAGLLTEFGTAVTKSLDEQLAVRVAQANDPDVLEVFVALASEARQLFGVRLILSLDQVELLAPDDFRYLLDLCTGLGPGVHLRLAPSTPTADARARVEQLRIAGGRVIQLEPLEDDAVMAWLKMVGIQPSPAIEVLRTSGGYPLFIRMSIEHVNRGGRLTELKGEDAFRAQIEQIFTSLNTEEQQAVVYAAAHTDPRSHEEMAKRLTISTDRWAILEKRLIDNQIFSTTVDSQPWFHELGRRAIWDAMTSAQRQFSAKTALDEMARVGEAGITSIQLATDLARLANDSPGFLAEHPGVAQVMSLERTALCIYGALLELGEPQMPALDLGSLLAHARERYALEGTLQGALDELSAANRVVIREEGNVAVIIGIYEEYAVRSALLGRVINELGLVPLPAIATAVFDFLIRPRIGLFVASTYGVGSMSLGRCGEDLRAMQADREGDSITLHKRPGLIVRAEIDRVKLFFIVAFNNEADRDSALKALAGVEEPSFFGMHFSVIQCFRWPGPLQPARKFIDAAEAGFGKKTSFLPIVYTHPSPRPIDTLTEELQLLRQARTALRSMATPLEIEILRLDTVPGYVCWENGLSTFVCEVWGLDEVRHIAIGPTTLGSTYQDEVTRLANLQPGQRVGGVTVRGGRELRDPLSTALNESARLLKQYNSTQGIGNRHKILWDHDSIKRQLTEYRQAILDGFTALSDMALFSGGDPTSANDQLCIALDIGGEKPWLVSGADGSLAWTTRPRQDGDDLVELVIGRQPEGYGAVGAWMQSTFGLDVAPDYYGYGELLGGLGRFLGFEMGQIEIIIPGSSRDPDGPGLSGNP